MSQKTSLRSPGAALCSGAALTLLLALAAGRPGHSDDRDLLRFSSAKPYLFILLDTSSSMNLKIGGGATAVIGAGDNPDSRIYAAKQALYNVFTTVDDVHFGFATFNQDAPRVIAKRWLYYNPNALPAAASWPLTYPAQDANGLTLYADRLNLTGADVQPPIGTPDDTDGLPDTVIADIQGDAVTIGPLFDFNGNQAVDAGETSPPGNSCASPLPLGAVGSTDRLKLNSFSLLNTPSDVRTTTLWISSGGKTYRLQVSRPATRGDGTPNAQLGQDNLSVLYTLDQVSACPATFSATFTYQPTLKQDPRFNEYVMVDGVPAGGAGESVPGLWDWSDAIMSGACGNSHPFSGKGWEGNYDSDDPPPAGVTLAAGFPTDEDRFCTNPADPATCVELKPITHTSYNTAYGRALDSGDMLPFDWTNPQKTAMLQRLAPNFGVSSPVEFGVAKLLTASAGAPGLYAPALAGRAPLIAAGNTPLGKAVLDFRCWYMGPESNKCKDYPTEDVGWSDTACSYDPQYGCRRPYLIVISDGGDNCPGENPAADTASMNSHSGIQTWVLNIGEPNNCAGNPLKNMAQNGKGECVPVGNPEDLLTTIQNILGKIREEARTFASAAVPSVQAVADQAIFLTDFTPLNNRSRWPGHLNSFLKPLPLTLDGRPDTSRTCGAGETAGCFTWDAGRVLANDQTQRYLSYARRSKAGLWPPNRTDLATTTDATPDDIRYDLWRAFELIGPTVADGSLTPAQETALQDEANAVITTVKAKQTRSPCDPTKDLCQYHLGDIFHSDPLVFGQSSAIPFLRGDLGSGLNPPNATCTAGDETAANFDRGYECFFRRQLSRRQVVFLGSNDGFLHAFNAAQFDQGTGRYDNGTGHELFAYMPRAVMPTVKKIAQGPVHYFTVDGAVQAADVFIDPIDDGDGVNYPVAAERRWRTVILGGLREGGRGYYALDVTQPDILEGPDGGPFIPNDRGNPNATPSCMLQYSAADCGPVPYGSPLWEFTDSTDNQRFSVPASQPALALTMDEDGNGLPDLGDSWSSPDVARILICRAGAPETDCRITSDGLGPGLEQRFVAIFGGGMDPERKSFDPRTASPTDPGGGAPTFFQLRGHWLYMVDMETGEVLYKRQLCSPYRTNAGNPSNPCVPGGSAPSEVAAVDTNLDGFVDRIYVGTVGGFLYRVDMQKVEVVAGESVIRVPALVPTTVNALDGVSPTAVTVMRVPATDASGNHVWNPYVIFDTNRDGATATVLPRSIYFRPAVIINQAANAFALAFGTGDREDLWNAPVTGAQTGRFYLFMDDVGNPGVTPPSLACPAGSPVSGFICPYTENDLRAIDPAGGSTSRNFLLQQADGSLAELGHRGWYLTLAANERNITDAFSFTGVTFFATYRPQVALTDANGVPLSNVGSCGQPQFEKNTTASCAKTGTSRLFLVNTTNGNGLLVDANNAITRSMTVSSFVTNPFTEFTTGSTAGEQAPAGRDADELTASDKAVQDIIRELMPKTCRFGTARVDIRTLSADTKLQKLAGIPVCFNEHNWKEF